jgi:multidrug efflux pump subunit AcrA (membrane-fusion protein)
MRPSDPVSAVARSVVIARTLFELFFAGGNIDTQVIAIILADDLHLVERDRDAVLAHAQEAPDINDRLFDLAVVGDHYDDEIFPAEISQVRYAPEEIDGVVNYKAILVIDNSSLRLRPGMTATADIVVAELSDVLMVPNAALRFAPPRVAESGGGDSSGSGLLGLIMPDRPGREAGMGEAAQKTLWLLRAGQAVEIPVTLGQSDGRFTAVLDGALAEGDLVITDQTGAE